jgi:hypothetical protein
MIIKKATSELELGDFARPEWLLIWDEDFKEVVYNEQDDDIHPSIWHTSAMGASGMCTVYESMGNELWLVSVQGDS